MFQGYYTVFLDEVLNTWLFLELVEFGGGGYSLTVIVLFTGSFQYGCQRG